MGAKALCRADDRKHRGSGPVDGVRGAAVTTLCGAVFLTRRQTLSHMPLPQGIWNQIDDNALPLICSYDACGNCTEYGAFPCAWCDSDSDFPQPLHHAEGRSSGCLTPIVLPACPQVQDYVYSHRAGGYARNTVRS